VTDLAPILQGFFTDRLARQKKASPNTVAAYRDTCKLLLAFAQEQTGKAPSRLSLADLGATLIGAFLQHLEDKRGNGSATRNARLAAIHSLFRYAAPRAPEHAAVISQVLAIPPRRRERAIVSYLTPEETDALLAAPDREPGTGAATTPCSCSPSRPACGYQSSPASPARTPAWAPARTSAATARAAKTGQHP
jgi:integrase/recombinase XerD